jgi:hypothetical protein
MGPSLIQRASHRALHRGVGGRGVLGRAFFVLALLALASPSLTAVHPDLAGWLPSHGHVYAGGVAVPHEHPWGGPAPTTMTFPAVSAEASGAGNADRGSADVAFTWDTSSTVKALHVPAVLALTLIATWLLRQARPRPLVPPSMAQAVPTPPPR